MNPAPDEWPHPEPVVQCQLQQPTRLVADWEAPTSSPNHERDCQTTQHPLPGCRNAINRPACRLNLAVGKRADGGAQALAKRGNGSEYQP